MTLAERLAAARTRAAVGPAQSRGVLRLAGKDVRAYLHRMCTQHVSGLAPGASAYAAFLDARGHLVGEGLLLGRADGVLVITEGAEAAPLAAHLRKYVIMDDVKVEDLSAGQRVVAVLGPEGRALALALPDATGSTPRRGIPAAEVVAGPERAEAIRAEMIAQGAVPLDEEDLEALRLEEGVPRFGADMDGERLPMEAGLTRDAIHFDKGCYVGQEVVLRATVRGHIQRGLVLLELPPAAGPGTPLSAGGKEVGRVTSAGETSQGRLGMGYVRRAHWREGERLDTPAGEARVRRVVVNEPA
jgi:tRNA-modifying protein YgfZ